MTSISLDRAAEVLTRHEFGAETRRAALLSDVAAAIDEAVEEATSPILSALSSAESRLLVALGGAADRDVSSLIVVGYLRERDEAIARAEKAEAERDAVVYRLTAEARAETLQQQLVPSIREGFAVLAEAAGGRFDGVDADQYARGLRADPAVERLTSERDEARALAAREDDRRERETPVTGQEKERHG